MLSHPLSGKWAFPEMLDVEDMVMVKIPDSRSIMTFLVTIYQHFNYSQSKDTIIPQIDICVLELILFLFSL